MDDLKFYKCRCKYCGTIWEAWYAFKPKYCSVQCNINHNYNDNILLKGVINGYYYIKRENGSST